MKKASTKESLLLRETPLVDEKDIFSNLEGDKGTSLFLGKYSMSEVVSVLRKKNFLKDAQKRKLWPLEFNLDASEYPLQRIQIFYREKKPENTIVDLKIKEGIFHPKKNLSLDLPLLKCKFLVLEWLTLQNPLQSFSSEKTPLPGQKYPGLNLGKKVLDIFVHTARLTRKDGILAFPAYFHNALLFSRAFQFLNPEKQGEILAIRKSFPEVTFKKLAWIVHLNCLRQEDAKIYKWKAEEQVSPLSKALEEYFESKAYKKKVKETRAKLRFEIDWECYYRKKAEQERQ